MIIANLTCQVKPHHKHLIPGLRAQMWESSPRSFGAEENSLGYDVHVWELRFQIHGKHDRASHRKFAKQLVTFFRAMCPAIISYTDVCAYLCRSGNKRPPSVAEVWRDSSVASKPNSLPVSPAIKLCRGPGK